MGAYTLPITIIALLCVIAVGSFFFTRKRKRIADETVSDPVVEEIVDLENQEVLFPLDSMIHMVEKIEISNSLGKSLVFESLDSSTALSTREYQEITARGTAIGANLAQGVMPALAQAQTLSEIAKNAPNGLFAATAPMTELMKYQDGTVGSIVMKNSGGIANHAGFQKVDVSALNSAAAIGAGMQALAMISGQYYMDKISEQLEGIERGIERLIGFHHDANIGKLRSTEHRIKEVIGKNHADETDIIALQAGLREADAVLMEYSTRLERLINTGKLTEVQVRKLLSRISAVKELKRLKANTEEHELFYSIHICLYASKLMLESKKAEFATRMKTGQTEKAQEAFDAFKQMYQQLQSVNTTEFLAEIYKPISDEAERLVNQQWIKTSKSKQELDSIGSERTELHKRISLILEDDVNEKMIRGFTDDSEVLFLPSLADSEPRIFISVQEDVLS